MKKLFWVFILIVGMVGMWTPSLIASPPSGNPGSPGDNCSHGNSNQECRDDPSDNGQDCDEHGNASGNEDHCDGTTTTTTTETTTTDETTTDETTTVDTTTTDETTTQETVTTPSGPRCPPGMFPTAGKDGAPGNDECEYPPISASRCTLVPAFKCLGIDIVPGPLDPGVTTPSDPSVTVTYKGKVQGSKKIVRVVKKSKGVLVITTADGKKHVAIQGQG